MKKTLFVLVLTILMVSGCVDGSGPVETVEQAPLQTTVPASPVQDTLAPTSTEPSPLPPTETATSTPTTAPLQPEETVEVDETGEAAPTPTQAALRSGPTILIDHTAVDGFDVIPDEQIAAAARIRYMIRESSIGVNIDQGLNCLMGNFEGRRPNSCGELFDPKYDRSNWEFQIRGNPGWIDKVNDFVEQVHLQADNFDAFSFSVGYVDGLDEGFYPRISDPENFQTLFVDKIEALEAEYPDKIFVWWTMSLSRVGSENGTKFNQMLREYTATHNKILFDLADIEAHNPDGTKVESENGYEVISPLYTNEEKSGHLNVAGRERVSRAFWYLMARLAGWEGIQTP